MNVENPLENVRRYSQQENILYEFYKLRHTKVQMETMMEI